MTRRGRGSGDVEDRLHARRARGEDDDAVGEHRGLLDVVGDEQRRARLLRERAGEPVAHLGAGDRVERAERLVEAEHRLAAEQRAQERDALAHAARELVRAGVLEARRGRTSRTAAAPGARALARSAPWMRSASAALSSASSHGSSRSRWGISTAGRGLDAPGVGRLQPADELEQRRLAAAGRADERDDLAVARRRASTPASASHGAAVAAAGRVGERDVPELHAGRGVVGAVTRDPGRTRRVAPRAASSSLPPRALPHRFNGSAPDCGARSQPAVRQLPGVVIVAADATRPAGGGRGGQLGFSSTSMPYVAFSPSPPVIETVTP